MKAIRTAALAAGINALCLFVSAQAGAAGDSRWSDVTSSMRVAPALTPNTLGDAATRENLVTSIFLEAEDLEKHNFHLQDKYAEIEANEQMSAELQTADCEILLVAYGIVSRVVRSAVARARAEGIKVGLFRPITLWPFPKTRLNELAGQVKHIVSVELSNGQMMEDIRLAVHDRVPVSLVNRMGGMVVSVEEVHEAIRRIAKEGGVR